MNPLYTENENKPCLLKNLQFKKINSIRKTKRMAVQHNKNAKLVGYHPCFPFISFLQPDLLCHYMPYLIKRNNGFREVMSQPIHCQNHGISESKVYTKTGTFRKEVQCRIHLLGQRCQRSSHPHPHPHTLWEKDEVSVHKVEPTSVTIPLFPRKGEVR